MQGPDVNYATISYQIYTMMFITLFFLSARQPHFQKMHHYDKQIVMTKIFFLSLVILLLVTCKKEAATNPVVTPSNMTFQLNSIDQVFFTKDSGSILSGVYHHKYTFIKTNANFDIEWTKNTYDWGNLISGSGWGANSYSVQIVKIFQRNDGSYVCIGTIMEGGDVVFYSTLVIELSQKGEQLHTYTFKDQNTSNALQTSDGGYILFGNNLIKLDRNFSQLWEKNLWDYTWYQNQIISTTDGGFATTGNYNGDKIFLKKLDQNGNEISSFTYEHNNSPFNENGSDLIQLQDKGFLIIGRTRNIGQINDLDCQIIRTNAAGDTIWTKRFGNSSNDWLNRFISTTQNEFVVQGTIGFPTENQKSLLVRFNTTGQILDSIRTEKFNMLVYSPSKFYIKVLSPDTAHVTFLKIQSAQIFK